MIYVNLPYNTQQRRLTFYLAMEEYVARKMKAGEYFFMWQVQPTVIFGRNQLIQNEVNLEYCRKYGIQTYRRKSGGGCVYADMNNIMFSYVTHDDNPVNVTFSQYISRVTEMLRRLGIDANTSGRNDIMIDGRKVSGNAFYHLPGRSIVHGTMLYDTDMQNMVASITPSDEKLVSKGIESVRQHITLLKDYIDIDIQQFKDFVKDTLCMCHVTLSHTAIEEIEDIEREYLSPEFIYGNNPRYNISRRGRIENVGDFDISLEMKNDIIKDIDIKGDFFLFGDIDSTINAALRNKPFTNEGIRDALPERLDNIIMNLRKDDFVDLIIGNNKTA